MKIKALRAADEDAGEREAFLKLASHIMRRLLIHHARPLYRKAKRVELSDAGLGMHSGAESLTEVEDLLERLEKLDPRLRRVVELRLFEGKTADETAVAMGCSARSVHKYWSFARRWLASEFGEGRAT